MKLPFIPEPERYVGLYVYDFGTHVSVGYTAAELCVLRENTAHRRGTAYQIYRVGDAGTIELCGVRDERLTAREAICFLRVEGSDAQRDYDAVCAAAAACPLPCVVQMQLAQLQDFDPPHVTALSYDASATHIVAGWLSQHAGSPGDQVVAGVDSYGTLMTSEGERLRSCQLPALLDYEDRAVSDVLRSVHEPLQR